MKKNKLKTLVKSARKSTTVAIRASLVAQLKETAEKLGVASKKTTKEIEKSAKNLAKKLAAEVKVDKDALIAAAQAKEVAAAKEAPAAEPAKAAEAKPVKAAKAKPEPVATA